MHSAIETIRNRISTGKFDPDFAMDREAIEDLVRLAQEAPTSFNLQNWRVVAFASPDEKARLQSAAFGQPKVAEAAVCFVFVGLLDAHGDLARLLSPAVTSGSMAQGDADRFVGLAQRLYAGNAQLQRDEAIRSSSLAAATLMLGATAEGLASCPMIGFDPKAVAEVAQLGENEVPAMLVCVGAPAEGNWDRKPRRVLDEQLQIR